jgi:ABC-type lipoprotein release transport system permease subunit
VPVTKRKIGIMKAVGADDRLLLFVFPSSGASIGLVGA